MFYPVRTKLLASAISARLKSTCVKYHTPPYLSKKEADESLRKCKTVQKRVTVISFVILNVKTGKYCS